MLKNKLLVYCVSSRNMAFTPPSTVPVITVPKYLEPTLKKLKFKLQKKADDILAKQSRRGDRNVLVISSKRNPALNHHLGQTYERNKEIPLATSAWMKSTTIGDELVFHPFSANKMVHDLKTDSGVSFSSLGLSDLVCEGLEAMNYKRPVEIQRLAIPEVLSNKNVMFSAETGCGKTIAYLAPLIENIRRLKQKYGERKNSPFGIIVVPSRELAIQIGTVASTLGSFCSVGVGINIGGPSQHITHTGKDLLVSTAGILASHIDRRIFDLSRLKTVVLDEADSLLDDSFNDYISDVFETIKFSDKESSFATQLVLVSATIPSNFEETLENFVDIDSIVKLRTPRVHHVMPHVRQVFMRIDRHERGNKLLELALQNEKKKKPTIIFVNRTNACNFAYYHLNDHQIPCVRLNKSIEEEERIESMRKFQSGECNFLVSTDVGSRGLDTRHVTRVINLDCPHHVADYIHRAGRTGRMTHTGDCCVTSFVSYKPDVAMVQELELSVRRQTSIANVNNNIKRVLHEHWNAKMAKMMSKQQ